MHHAADNGFGNEWHETKNSSLKHACDKFGFTDFWLAEFKRPTQFRVHQRTKKFGTYIKTPIISPPYLFRASLGSFILRIALTPLNFWVTSRLISITLHICAPGNNITNSPHSRVRNFHPRLGRVTLRIIRAKFLL